MYLDLSENKLSEVPHFGQSDLKVLEKLNISSNELTMITPLVLPELTEIDVSNNKIK